MAVKVCEPLTEGLYSSFVVLCRLLCYPAGTTAVRIVYSTAAVLDMQQPAP